MKDVQLHKRISRAIRAIEQRPRAAQHFTLHSPQFHDSPLVVQCPAGHAFSTSYLDMRTLPEMIEFINAHVQCTAPEQERGEP